VQGVDTNKFDFLVVFGIAHNSSKWNHEAIEHRFKHIDYDPKFQVAEDVDFSRDALTLPDLLDPEVQKRLFAHVIPKSALTGSKSLYLPMIMMMMAMATLNLTGMFQSVCQFRRMMVDPSWDSVMMMVMATLNLRWIFQSFCIFRRMMVDPSGDSMMLPTPLMEGLDHHHIVLREVELPPIA